MSVKRLSCLLVCLSIITSPLASSADYIIYLKNGREIVTSKYWKQDNEIMFDINGNMAGIKESAILKIDSKDTSNEIAVPSEEKVQNVNIPNIDKNIDNTKNINIEEYKKKKEVIKSQIDDVLEKFREASGNKDEQEKLRQEISGLSKQIYAINDDVKKQNHGRLPEGWMQE
jgi:hypothetical protein